MKVVYVPVNGEILTQDIEETLDAFWALVEGPFDYEPITTNMALVFNDNQRKQPYSFTYKGQRVNGPAFFVGINGKHWDDCPKTKEEIENDII